MRRGVRWSWKLAEIAGIAVYVHATFLVLVAWLAFVYWLELGNLTRVFSGVGLFLLLFVCVLLHEFGHALTAKTYGFTTREITLLPIGGIARLERLPDDPVQALWITLAGPAVNVVIAAALFATLRVTGQWEPLGRLSLTEGPFLERLMLVNVTLAAFNMLPAFPMDGGRVLRALLAMYMDPVRATRIAARLGQGMAVLFAIVGWLANPFLLIIAAFVWIGATQEAQMVAMRSALRRVAVDRAMITEFRTLTPDDRLATAVKLVLHGVQRDFPIMRDGRVVGMLTRRDLLRGLAAGGLESRVGDAMQRDVEIVDSDDLLDAVLGRLEARERSVALVVHGGRLAGVLTTEGVAEFLSFQAALGTRQRDRLFSL